MRAWEGGQRPPRGSTPRCRRGLAIPLAGGFCVLVVIVIIAVATSRTGVKRQSRASFQALKAHYVAQGAIQVALLKFRVLPNEGYEASEASRGGNDGPLQAFLSDVGTDALPLGVSPTGTWSGKIKSGKVLNAVRDGDYGDWLHVVTLTAEGTVQDGFLNADGAVENRIEEVVKTAEVRKERAP